MSGGVQLIELEDLGYQVAELIAAEEEEELVRLDKLHLGECPVCGFLVRSVEGLKGTQCSNCGYIGSCCG